MTSCYYWYFVVLILVLVLVLVLVQTLHRLDWLMPLFDWKEVLSSSVAMKEVMTSSAVSDHCGYSSLRFTVVCQ